MKDPILLNKLWQEVEAGRVAASTTGDLTIFKYTQDTHIQNLWNDVNRLARGIIFRTDGTIVARPFSKFFNLGEMPESSPENLPWSEGVEVYEKVDGSMGIGYRQDNQWKLATPGSMESEQAVEGTKMLSCYDMEAMPTYVTPLFEIIYPQNRIVVNYGETRELVLLAIIEHNGKEWHPRRVDQMAACCDFHRPLRYNIDLRGKILFAENSEGYVARFESGLRVKIKSPTYLRIHRLLNFLSPKGVIELIRGKEYRATLAQLPPEIAKDFDDIRAYVQELYNKLFTSAHDNLNRLLLEIGKDMPRKLYAEWVQTHVPSSERGFVFALLDNKPIEDRIWKLVQEQIKDNGKNNI